MKSETEQEFLEGYEEHLVQVYFGNQDSRRKRNTTGVIFMKSLSLKKEH